MDTSRCVLIKMTSLAPNNIFFSQDSINNVFDRRSLHSNRLIGETLDSIYEERCSIYDLPTISVAKIGDRWVTHDNRRLWVFRQLYRLGKCDTVPVNIKGNIPSTKMTSCNNGVDIQVRGDPGGQWHQKPSQRPNSLSTNQGISSVYGHHQQDFAHDESDDPDQYVVDDYSDYYEHEEYDDYDFYYEHEEYDDYGGYCEHNDFDDYEDYYY